MPGSAVDDGSNHIDNCAMDEDDPNYDSEDDNGTTAIPKYSPLHRDNVAKSNTSLVSYKKRVEGIITEYFVSGDMDDIAYYIQVGREPATYTTFSFFYHYFFSSTLTILGHRCS